jgi:hypothetical protein
MLRQESAECLVGKYINAYFVLDTFLVDLSKLVDQNQDGRLPLFHCESDTDD